MISLIYVTKSAPNGDRDQRGNWKSQPVDGSLYQNDQRYVLPEKWLPVSIAPSDIDLEVSVMDRGDVHALVFPVRKSGTDWVDASTKKLIDIAPTHWCKWNR